MNVMSIALGGCLCGRPMYGITQDTGGHIAYILGEMNALAQSRHVTSAEIVTRLFTEPSLHPVHSQPCEVITPKLRITRINSGDTRYLVKEALEADRKAFIEALITNLSRRRELPDLIHAHFADAAEVAEAVRQVFGIPFVYTAHSLGLDKANATAAVDHGLRRRIGEETRAIANAAAIIGSSRDECERQLLSYPGVQIGKIHRITPGTVKTEENHEAKARELISPFLRHMDRPIILAIARPVWKKNLAAIVDAFGADERLRGMANLVIVAGQRGLPSEPDSEHADVFRDLLARIDGHDLYGSVAYPKTHDEQHIAGLYQLAASTRGAFVNPALIEPYGLTIVEAASYGVPVVATCHGGTVDTVTELGHGELVDPRRPGDIADAIFRLLTDGAYWDHCSSNGAMHAKRHTWASYAEHFVKIAQGVIERTAPRLSATVRANCAGHLLACDLDNTLTGCNEGVAAFKRMLSRRPTITFVIATGRSLVEARRIMREWDLPDPSAWITDVGTRIYWPSADGPIEDMSYLSNIGKNWDAEGVRHAALPLHGLTLQPQYDQNDYKCSWFYSDPAQVQRLQRTLNDAGCSARVIASHDYLLDVLPVEAGKAAGVLHVASRLGIPARRIIAAGDSGNDIDMLEIAAHPVVVANHTRELVSKVAGGRVIRASRAYANGVVEGLETVFANIETSPSSFGRRAASYLVAKGIAA